MAELLDQLGTLFQGGFHLGLGVEHELLVRYGLLFLGCAAVLWLVVARTRLRMGWFQKAAMALLRTGVVALLILALLDIAQTQFRRALAVVLLVDVSQSIPDEELERVRAALDESEGLRGEAVVHTLTFAADPSQVDEGKPPARREGGTETNLQNALHLAYDLFPPGYASRALIFTDGNQTHGDLQAEARVARDRNVEVSFVPLNTRAMRDAYVQSLNLPRRARTGEEITVSARIIANHAATARVRLARNGRVLESREAELQPGENWQEFTLAARGTGEVAYSVTVEAEQDADRENDAMDGRMEVLSRPRVLFITDRAEDDAPLIGALQEGGIRVQPAPLEAFPTRIGELNYFDLVVLSDPDPEAMGESEVDLLASYLRDYGGGVVYLGGEAASAMGREGDDLPLEAILPVRMKEKKKTEPNPVAMILVLDKSNSMGRQNKFGMAIRAVKDAIRELPPHSMVGIIVFDDRPYETVPMTDVENADAIERRLDELGVDGGTSIYPALELAYNRIRRQPHQVRHVILLSDGFSNTRYRQNARLIEEYRNREITITTVGLGRECDPQHLAIVAREGGGEFYHVQNIEEIPRIFVSETQRITRTNIVEQTFQPTVLKRAGLIAQVDLDAIPELTGYNASTPRPSSETFLLAEGREPLLARWRYGLGRVVSFASDSGADWSSAWGEWDQYGPFWTGVVRGTLRDVNFQLFRVSARSRGDRIRVSVDAADTHGNFLNNLDLQMEITGPDDQEIPVELRQERPGGYAGSFAQAGFGSYAIRLTPRIEGRRASESFSRIDIAPPSEFVHLEPNQNLMRQVAETTGGLYDPSLAEVFRLADENFPSEKPLWPYLVLLAVGLYLVNLLLRRT